MKAWIENAPAWFAPTWLSAGGFGSAAGNLLGLVAWKSFAILALVCLMLIVWRRGAAALRHLAWVTAFVCLLALPVLVQCLPSWPSPAWVNSRGINSLPDSLKFVWKDWAPENPRPATALVEGQNRAIDSAQPAPVRTHRLFLTQWNQVVVGIWLLGVAIGWGRMASTRLRLRRLAGEMSVCEEAGALGVLERLRLAQRIKRPVKLLISPADAAPMTWGWWHPVITLPAAAREWSRERLEVVLRHELAHVRRWDCLTQDLAQVACAFYWFNPLAWLAARQMRLEREKACDDLVLNTGAQPSEYAGHLVAIARQFALAGASGAVPMARPSGLEQRVRAILDARRDRAAVKRVTAALMVLVIFSLGVFISGCVTAGSAAGGAQTSWASFQDPAVAARLKAFVAEKTARVDAATNEVPREFKPFFAAAGRGDWLSVSNRFADFRKHAPQYERIKNEVPDPRLHGTAWEAVKEVWGAFAAFSLCSEKYSAAYGRDIVDSIPPGSIYFGGTDPGRFLITAWQENQVTGNPFFTLTQNALADGTYLDYLRAMYGGKIYIPTSGDQQKCFQDYTADAKQRLKEKKLKPGEMITVDPVSGRVNASGVTAVMGINGLLVKVIFDENPGREFYLEESFALDWMYPYLEPHGLIFKINRTPLSSLPDDLVRQDQNYWSHCLQPMVGDWLMDDTSVEETAAFVKKTFGQGDFSGFTGDRQYILSDWACLMFSKERFSIADLYAWRAKHDAGVADKQRMVAAADLAFRQAWVLCPYTLETVKGYLDFLLSQKRGDDALLMAETAVALPQMHAKDREALGKIIKQVKPWHDEPSAAGRE